jgi:hypothetical protein
MLPALLLPLVVVVLLPVQVILAMLLPPLVLRLLPLVWGKVILRLLAVGVVGAL